MLYLMSKSFSTMVAIKGFRKLDFSSFNIPSNIGQKAGNSFATILSLSLFVLWRRWRVSLAKSLGYSKAADPVDCKSPATLVGLLMFVRNRTNTFGICPWYLILISLTSRFNIQPFLLLISGEVENSPGVIPPVTNWQTSFLSLISLKNTLSLKCDPWARISSSSDDPPENCPY